MSWLLIQWHLSGPKSQSRINSKFDRRLSAANCMGSTGRFDFLSSSLPSGNPLEGSFACQISAHQANPLQALNYRRKLLSKKTQHFCRTTRFRRRCLSSWRVGGNSSPLVCRSRHRKKEWKHVLRCIDDTWARKQRNWGKKRNSTSSQQESTEIPEIPERHLAPTCKCGPGVSIAASTIFSFCCNSGLANSKEFLGFEEMKWIPIFHKCSVIHCHH